MQATQEIEQQTTEVGRELPETISALSRLSMNYWWSWAPDGAPVFRDLDPDLWERCEQNPRVLLEDVSEFRLTKLAVDPVYIARVRRLAERFDAYLDEGARTWAGGRARAITRDNPVAYFCAEFGVHNSLPIYSGGLGVLAGDHLKSASDLGLPLVGVGLLYHQGYFRQHLGESGLQQERYVQIDPARLPLRPALTPDGALAEVELSIRGRRVLVRAWRVEVGRVALYLLDTNVRENAEIDRYITMHLYGGDRETRCVQEMVLGVGGARLLRRLGVEPHVFHLNEGHSAFLTLELARELTQGGDLSFEDAAARVRRRCVFTTHTPVAAGHDEFAGSLVELCFGHAYRAQLGLTHEEFMNLGRVRAGAEEELFGLTPLALRMCRSSNGVSRKHGEVSRELWAKMYPEIERTEDVPITSVTNGVHAPTWINPLLRSVFEAQAGEGWAESLHDAGEWSKLVAQVPDEELWRVKRLLKHRLVAFVRQRVYQSRQRLGESAEYTEAARRIFNPEALTIGFARRVAAYKRWAMILTDRERLLHLLADSARPVQFVFAGKAHPQDQGAKFILQQMALWKRDPRVTNRAVFVEDYDHEIARQLVQGVDVWMNVPRRPLEASGTSGEKAAINGGLNLSILDGWWIEGCLDGENGWAVGDPSNEADLDDEGLVEEGDARDAESLYRIIEEKVVPAFYERDGAGIPRRWVGMVRRAVETLAPAFNSDRMVRDYVRDIYLAE